MPETISRAYAEGILRDIADREPELALLGGRTFAKKTVRTMAATLGGGRYVIVMPEDSGAEEWATALGRLDTLAPGAGEWLVTDSVSYGPVLASYVSRG